MTGFTVVDVIVVLLVVAAAIAGYRQGFITAMFTLVTAVAGAIVAIWLAPMVMDLVQDSTAKIAIGIACVNQVELERLRAEGMDYVRFRETLRDQMLLERVREREVQGRIRITDGDIDKYLDERRSVLGKADQVKASAKQAGENVKDAAQKTGENVRDAFEK